VLRYASAGHAPPFLRLCGGKIRTLANPSAPLGAFRNVEFQTHEQRCPDGSMLVLYTDGIIEASRDIVAGERMLQRVLKCDAVMRASNPAEFIERAIAHEAPRDDIAIMTLVFGRAEKRWQFEASDARAAYTMRDDYLRSLSRACSLTSDDRSACSLIFAELIGNAVRHAPGPISVSLEFRGKDAVLHVIDKGRGFTYEPALPSTVWAESGRGLYLISMLAKHVRVEPVPGLGSHVIVTLPISCKDSSKTASQAA
jgi:anti-sigma regulatory factor (Ser/Thr protein kinase)